MSSHIPFNFDNSYTRLPERFYERITPIPVSQPKIILFNKDLSEALGINLSSIPQMERVGYFSGNIPPVGSIPIAQAYAGHQFGNFNILGDGRAVLLGEHLTPLSERFDIQLKGSGRTSFSRRGDGRAALAPMLREYIISEAMYHLGIPTTRSLAVTTTGEKIMRDGLQQGAILTRVASSHIRVGTFELLAAKKDIDGLKILADYAIARHFPSIENTEDKYLNFLYAVIDRQASLISKWLQVGFIHGVMNTDNMAISGETIDYGPCAFMDVYDPQTVFSSIDHDGRYAYGNQAYIAQWNLARFAEALLPLFHHQIDKAIPLAEEAVDKFSSLFQGYWLNGMRYKLGLANEERDDKDLIQSLLQWMHKHKLDYTRIFRAISMGEFTLESEQSFSNGEFIAWGKRWKNRLGQGGLSIEESYRMMRSSNPALIPRNYLVEESLEAATDNGDFSKLERLLSALSEPYMDRPQYKDLSEVPSKNNHSYQTFCGT